MGEVSYHLHKAKLAWVHEYGARKTKQNGRFLVKLLELSIIREVSVSVTKYRGRDVGF